MNFFELVKEFPIGLQTVTILSYIIMMFGILFVLVTSAREIIIKIVFKEKKIQITLEKENKLYKGKKVLVKYLDVSEKIKIKDGSISLELPYKNSYMIYLYSCEEESTFLGEEEVFPSEKINYKMNI